MKVRIYWRKHDGTPNGRRVCKRHLPYRQTLIWCGPMFILVQR